MLIGICETWLTKRIHDNLIKIDCFNLARYDRKQPKRGGGLLLYINDAIDFKKDVITKPKVTFTFRDLKKYNLAILLYKFTTNDWSDLYAADNPTTCWNRLYDIYLAVLDSVAPFITKTNVPAKDEWLDDNCLTKIQKRDELRGRLRYSNEPTLRKEFNEARNVARQATNNARSEFVKQDIAAHAKSPKKFWARLKSLMPGKKGDKSSRSPPIRLTDSSGAKLTDNSSIANPANQFFINIGPQLAAIIKADNTEQFRASE